jgi:HEAT repeat protein
MLKCDSYERINQKVEISAETRSQIERLIADLRSPDGEIRREARETLTFIGKPAVDFLLPLLQEPGDDVRWEATKALAEIADPRAASELVSALMDHDYGIRWMAGEGLIRLGRHGLKPLLEKLTEHSESTWLRRGAHRYLKELTRNAPEFQDLVGPVISALEGFESEIGVIGPAHAALDTLKQELPEDECEIVKQPLKA